MNKKKPGRRRLVKSIAVGSVISAGKSLPESWSRPVVNAIMLPAHGQTTNDTGSQPPDAPSPTTPPQQTTLGPGCCDIEGNYCSASLTWPAYATSVFIKISVTAQGSIALNISLNQFERVYSATASTGCAGGSFDATATTGMLAAAAQIIQDLPAPPDSISIAAQVVCDSDSIKGTITANDGSGNSLKFSAFVNSCPG